MAATAKPRRNVTARPAESVRTEVDSRRLASELASNLRGEVRFDAGSRALYAKDYSVYQHLPIGVIVPRDVEGVVAAVEVCRRYGAPILARGCGTSPQRAMLQRGRDHRLLQIPCGRSCAPACRSLSVRPGGSALARGGRDAPGPVLTSAVSAARPRPGVTARAEPAEQAGVAWRRTAVE
jgi:hypothetical protein